MIALWKLFVPGLTAVLNRYWRGEGHVARYVWQLFNFGLAFLITFNIYFAIGWLIFSIGYAVPAWQAMFSAAHGHPPQRRDSWYIDWLQTLTYKLLHMDSTTTSAYGARYWFEFGIVYGALRAIFVLPGVFYLTAFTHSVLPLLGLCFLGMGQVYYWGGKISRHFNTPAMCIAFSEIMMGWLCGTYLLICAAQL